MYCNHCGAEMQEGQLFCGKCGKGEKKPENLVCRKCGTPLGEDTNFCNVCGTPVREENKQFCRFYGTEVPEGMAFCVNCGKAIDKRRAAAVSTTSKTTEYVSNGWFGGRFNNAFTQKVDEIRNKISTKLTDVTSAFGGELADRRAASLGWKHILAAFLVFVLIILYYVPTIQLKFPIDYDYSNYKLKDVTWASFEFSLGNPFQVISELGIDSLDSTLKTASTLSVVSGVFLALIPMLIVIVFCILPFFRKNFLKKRRMIYPLIVAFQTHLGLVLSRILSSVVLSAILPEIFSSSEIDRLENLKIMPHVTLTFGGVLMLLVSLSLIALLFVISFENKKIMEENAQ